MEDTPNALVHYRNIVMDSCRWKGFEFREDDIVVSTPPKSGTTWTQMICALLIFGGPGFPRALDLISPWLDQSLRDLDEVFADLAAQEHRRFIKTHTPLDGLPFDDRVTYICVGRDPRDAMLSWANHLANLNHEAFQALRAKVVGFDDIAQAMAEQGPPPELSESEQFSEAVESADDAAFATLSSHLHHIETFWAARDRPNVVMLHYSDLQADLEGQMRALASRLGIEIAEDAWERLVHAAGFEQMQARATEVAPNSTEPIWVDTARFFNRGTSGQWRDLVDGDGLRRYEGRVRELTDDTELARWVHNGSVIKDQPRPTAASPI